MTPPPGLIWLLVALFFGLGALNQLLEIIHNVLPWWHRRQMMRRSNRLLDGLRRTGEGSGEEEPS